MDVAARRLRDLSDPATKTSYLIAADARRRAPRATGTLRAAISPASEGNTARVVVPVRYAWPVHSGVREPLPGHQPGRPFLADAASGTQAVWTSVYAGQVDEVMGTVKGA